MILCASFPVEISTREYAMTSFRAEGNFVLDAQLPQLGDVEYFGVVVVPFAEGALL
jgi:hypothetical protein